MYKENRNRLKDAIIKEENNNKLNESEQRLINKYYGAKKILTQWIEENKPTYFNNMKIVVDEFSHSIVANYFLQLNNDKSYTYYKNDLYCFHGII